MLDFFRSTDAKALSPPAISVNIGVAPPFVAAPTRPIDPNEFPSR